MKFRNSSDISWNTGSTREEGREREWSETGHEQSGAMSEAPLGFGRGPMSGSRKRRRRRESWEGVAKVQFSER